MCDKPETCPSDLSYEDTQICTSFWLLLWQVTILSWLNTTPFIISQFCRAAVWAQLLNSFPALVLQGWKQGVIGGILSGSSGNVSALSSFVSVSVAEFRTEIPVSLPPTGWELTLHFQKLHVFLILWLPSCIFKASDCRSLPSHILNQILSSAFLASLDCIPLTDFTLGPHG